MSVKWSKLSRTKISWQWFLPQGCWRLQIKGTEKHFRKLKSFTSPAWTRVSVLFHRFSYSKPAVQKNQRPVKQNPVNICLIHVALPGKFIFRWMKMPWYFIKTQYIHLGCGKDGCWVSTPGVDAKPFPSEGTNLSQLIFPKTIQPKSALEPQKCFHSFSEDSHRMVSCYLLFLTRTHSVENLSC